MVSMTNFRKIWKQFVVLLLSATLVQFLAFNTVLAQKSMSAQSGNEADASAEYKIEQALAFRTAANELYTAGKFSEALEEYSKSIKENPQDRIAWYNRTLCKLKLKDRAGALADLNHMTIMFPTFVSAYYLRGTLFYEDKDWKRAKIEFSKILDFRESDALIYRKRGTVRYQLNDRSGALSDYNRSIELNPKDPIAFHDRGITREYLGDKKGAKIDFQVAKDLDLAAAKKSN
jgi:tetratricopeptide (TPR) repeat protein